MLVAISGTHGAGKTTTIKELKRRNPDWEVISEITRTLVPLLEYESPYDIVAENGIAIYESAILGQWYKIARGSNPDSSSIEKIRLVDRSPIDNLAYYFVHRREDEIIHEKFLTRLANAYLSNIDLHIHVPLLPFTVPLEDVQRIDTQADLQSIIVRLYSQFGIRYEKLSTTTIEDRCSEVIAIINRHHDMLITEGK
jgi:predicted ATPase